MPVSLANAFRSAHADIYAGFSLYRQNADREKAQFNFTTHAPYRAPACTISPIYGESREPRTGKQTGWMMGKE